MLGVVSPSSNTMKASPAFPSIEESHNEHEDHHEENNNNTVNVVDGDWEMLSHASSILSRNKTLKHCASSPDFSFYGHTNDININSGSEEASEEDSAFSSYADNFTIDTEVSDLVMVNGDTTPDDGINSGSAVPQTPTSTPMKQKPMMKKVPSFKDAILLNSQEKEKEARLLKEQEEKRLSGINKQRRPFQRAKFVVKNVTGTKRCPRSASVPNLQSLAIVDEEDYDGYHGGGGGGCGGGDDEVLGMSDASDYYARKKHGSVTYRQGQKLRPDEAKRKKMIMYKKNLQRQGR